MTCRRAKPLLSEYIDGACSPKQRAQMEQHVDACAECSALLQDLQRTTELVSQLPAKRTSGGFMAALTPKLRKLEQKPDPGLLRRAWQWLLDSQVRWQTAAGGALVLIVAVGLFGTLNRGGEAPPPPTVATVDLFREHHRSFAATTVPFDDQAFVFTGQDSGM